MSSRNPSPLRYPGGKTALASVLEAIIYANDVQGGRYIEPFAGGAGAALSLLFSGHVDQIVINDADPAIFAFWSSVLNRPGQLSKKVQRCELSIAEWRNQRSIYRSSASQSRIRLGFSAFYLNRCNRSGIIANGGPIGGIEQTGEWKLDARFNRDALVDRIQEIADYRDRITVTDMDAIDLLMHYGCGNEAQVNRSFIYADPPYYVKGGDLYLNHFKDEDHDQFAAAIRRVAAPWVMTYDDHPYIRRLYADLQIIPFQLRYSANHSSKRGGELLIAPKSVEIPDSVWGMLRKCA